MNEAYKLLDNNHIQVLRGDVQVDPSVSVFIEILFRGGNSKEFSQKATHEDVFRLIQSTELTVYISEAFPKLFISSHSLLPEGYWLSLLTSLRGNTSVIGDMLFFYSGIFFSDGDIKLFNFLKEVWVSHRNPVYSLSALIIIHLLGMNKIKESLC
jgi:hypothetical protein